MASDNCGAVEHGDGLNTPALSRQSWLSVHGLNTCSGRARLVLWRTLVGQALQSFCFGRGPKGTLLWAFSLSLSLSLSLWSRIFQRQFCFRTSSIHTATAAVRDCFSFRFSSKLPGQFVFHSICFLSNEFREAVFRRFSGDFQSLKCLRSVALEILEDFLCVNKKLDISTFSDYQSVILLWSQRIQRLSAR